MNNIVQIDSPVAMSMSNLLKQNQIPAKTLKASGIVKIMGADDVRYRLESQHIYTLEIRTDRVIAEIMLDYMPTAAQQQELFLKHVKPAYPELELI